MNGHAKDHGKRSAGYGWLNPFFTRTSDGNTEFENYSIISKTNFDQLIDKELMFAEIEDVRER